LTTDIDITPDIDMTLISDILTTDTDITPNMWILITEYILITKRYNS